MTDGTDEGEEAAVEHRDAAGAARPRPGFWFGFIAAVVKPFMVVCTRQDFRGREHVPRTGGVVFVTNHISHFDPFVVGFYLWECRRIPRFLGKASLFRLPVLGRILTSAGQIPVFRDSPDAADALRAAVAAVERGECVGVYPEGTITRDPGIWPMTPKTGAARIALRTGCPVIPIAGWGAHEVIPPYRRSFRLLPRKTMRAQAGPPVDLSAFHGRPMTAELLQKASIEIMSAVAAELGRLRGEQPPAELYDLRSHRPGGQQTITGADGESR